MMFGTLVHQTIEDVHKAAISGKTELITKDNIEAWFNANYASLKSAESFDLAEPQKKAALGQVQRYVEKRKGDWSSIRRAEVDVSLVKEDYIIEGTIDLIRGEGDTVEIVDFKSEKKPDETKNADRIERYRQQLQVYAHIVEERTGLRVSRMNLYYTGDESDSPQISFPYREEAVEETIRQFDDTVHRILNKEFTACDKDARVCNECDFRHFCRRR
jgi:DNA helicase-2/ATP-dependent DNA helicase PcrA